MGSFTASHSGVFTGGDINLANASGAALDITGISQTATTGISRNVIISNDSQITTSGAIASTGNVDIDTTAAGAHITLSDQITAVNVDLTAIGANSDIRLNTEKMK